MNEQIIDKIFSMTKKLKDGCWIWTGSLAYKRFPQIYVVNKPISVRRTVYEHFRHQLKEDCCLKYTCKAIGCINPDHAIIWKHKITRGKRKPRPKSKKHQIKKFLSFVEKTKTCWLWRGAVLNTGYGVVRILGRPQTTQRASYELFIGKIPPNLEIDHLCRNRICVNPNHLEAITKDENLRRARESRKDKPTFRFT